MAEILFESYYGTSSLGSPYLMHHGIKGQKWYHRRFQNEDGSLTTLGRLHYGIGKGRKEEGAKELVEAYDKKRKEEKAAAKATKAEVSKEKLLTSGTPKQLLDNADLLTNQELQQAVNRLNMKKQLSSMLPPKKNIVEVTTNILNTATNAMNSITNVKNAYERLQTAFESDEEKEKREAKESEKQAKKAREAAIQKGVNADLAAQVVSLTKKVRDENKDRKPEEIERAVKDATDKFLRDVENTRTTKSSSDAKSDTNSVMARIKRQQELSAKQAKEQKTENDTFINKLKSISNKYENERDPERFSTKSTAEARDSQSAYDRLKKLMNSAGSTSTSAVSSNNSRSDNDSFISKLSSVANQYSSERETKTPSIFERAVGSVATGQSTVSSMQKASLSKRVGNLMSSVSDRASVDRGRELASSNNELLNKSLGFLDDLDKK